MYKQQIYQIAESNRIETFLARIAMLYWLGLYFLQQVSLREYVCLVHSAVGCAVGPTSTIASGVLVLAGCLLCRYDYQLDMYTR